MRYNPPIDRIGNPVEATKQRNAPNPLWSGLRQSYRCQVWSALYAATKPKARSTMGFLLSSRLTRQGASANGPAWAAPSYTEGRDSQTGLSQGCNSHTEAAWFNSGGWGRLKAARPDTAQVNHPTLCSLNGVGGGFAVNLSRLSDA